ncbi:YhzD family protein [Alteribacillus sp. HJP-4]|uniref:YhzD family protein n=1 Tax=Alteribacillus sp. HJP-4 TaxID=2775394 RepID=UPI0035CCD80C
MHYFLTVFQKDGKLSLNATFEFDNDEEAIAHGRQRLEEENCAAMTHRLTRSGKLLIFQR